MVAPSMVGGVRFAGGWVFDRVAAGWDVTVLTADGTDSRALRILGVRGIDLDKALNSRIRGPRPLALALDAALFESDELVRRKLFEVLDGDMHIRLWGGRRAGEVDPALDEVPGRLQHRLSSAARAFKTHALAAASAARVPAQCVAPDRVTGDCTSGAPVPGDPATRATEVFWSAEILRSTGAGIT
ncbi:hypothetical protein E1281_06615 [Actinomadura sp. KC345]|uniref:hypothetical protein n=1 Tax=Actinomadura sp. KC345 TaxID=2530371 RepID=UPI001046A8F3|nr:hypothetical protein [Actinomadura sp. KC345]TDC56790.1 hypothetical protein E1281_06615 [Actinomadura sp. KC345]